MSIQITPSRAADRGRQERKITCVTCQLKGCVGRCRFEKAAAPPPRRAA